MDENSNSRQPIIVKYVSASHTNVESIDLRRHCIGMVMQGTKYIHNGDMREPIRAGEAFYAEPGTHHVEHVPESAAPFRQIVFYYTCEQLRKAVSNLSLQLGAEIPQPQSGSAKGRPDHLISGEGAKSLGGFFHAVDGFLGNDAVNGDTVVEELLLMQLIYLAMRYAGKPVKEHIFAGMCSDRAYLEQIVRENLFSDIPITELARKCNKSLTSFKKDFKVHFGDSPHRWIIRQRLAVARVKVISTRNPVSQIGNECGFPNTSHFIKCFSGEFGQTPVAYRRAYREHEYEKALTPSI